MPCLKTLRKDIHLKNFFSDETRKGTSLLQTSSFEYQATKSTGAFRGRVVARSEKKLANKNAANSSSWAVESFG
jgi:hypothetical protein